MLTAITHSQIYVHDQDRAVDFYVGTLGLEVSADVDLGFAVDDCRKTYEALRARGVEFTEDPTERPFGVDCALRDPFGNSIRLTEPTSQGPV